MNQSRSRSDSYQENRHVQEEVGATRWIPITAIVLDAIILAAFLWMKATNDVLVIWVSAVAMVFIFAGERLFLSREDDTEGSSQLDASS